MIDKLKKIAELSPELLGYLNIHMDNLEAWLDTSDRQWMLIGRLIDDLTGKIDAINFGGNFLVVLDYRLLDDVYYPAPTLLEAVCDAWLALKEDE